ncbi:MAG TPA: hypothetical protein VK668_24535 [Mucilaginibacter sp.]|nr:hypothetical protein [Mucilaginibacter sp.]
MNIDKLYEHAYNWLITYGPRLVIRAQQHEKRHEFRPTINVFSKGRFSESLCLGGGYVFNSRQALMTEICNSINFNISENLEVAVMQGYCFFDGTNSSRSAQYMGFSFTYNFLKPHSVNKQRKKKAIVSDN